jgi:glycosyltransferase involved in cell wall biosynthesis
MKGICIISQSPYDFDPRVRRKAEALVAAGYFVDVLSLPSPGAAKRYVLNGVNVRTASLGKKRGSLMRYAFEYLAFFVWASVRVHLQMRERRYVVIDVNTLPDFLVFAPFLARRMGAKIILDMHEITPEFYMSKYGIRRDSWMIRFLTYQEQISCAFADHVITINEPIQDLLEARGLEGSKSTVIMNAVDEARFATATPAVAPTKSADLSKFVMIYHGTLTRIYGLDIAIEAFATVHRDMPGAEIWILGSGPEQASLAALATHHGITQKVKLFGQVKSSEIPRWLAQSDAGILPIRHDALLEFAFPNKLPEYIIMGKPVMVSRLKALKHYFSESAVAFAEPNDTADLAAQMVRVYKDRDLRGQLAAQARTEYAPIRWDVMKARYLTLIERLTGVARQTADAGTAETRSLAQ